MHARFSDAVRDALRVKVLAGTRRFHRDSPGVATHRTTQRQPSLRYVAHRGLAGTPHAQGRRHGVDWGGHANPTFARGCS